MSAIAVVDCGMGNLHSVVAGIKRAAAAACVRVTAAAAEIAAADKVILPGDGNFGACMAEIDKRGLRQTLCAAAAQKPFLGICVGMQVLFERSEEAASDGLGVLPGAVLRLPTAAGVKIPHIGWNTATCAPPSPHTAGIADGAYFYFVHSYCAPPGAHTLMTCDYGMPFSAAVGRGALFATQFHPEKSGAAGRRLLQNFLAGAGAAAA